VESNADAVSVIGQGGNHTMVRSSTPKLRPLKQSLHIPWRDAIHSTATPSLRSGGMIP
jgi:hypothetical protein